MAHGRESAAHRPASGLGAHRVLDRRKGEERSSPSPRSPWSSSCENGVPVAAFGRTEFDLKTEIDHKVSTSTPRLASTHPGLGNTLSSSEARICPGARERRDIKGHRGYDVAPARYLDLPHHSAGGRVRNETGKKIGPTRERRQLGSITIDEELNRVFRNRGSHGRLFWRTTPPETISFHHRRMPRYHTGKSLGIPAIHHDIWDGEFPTARSDGHHVNANRQAVGCRRSSVYLHLRSLSGQMCGHGKRRCLAVRSDRMVFADPAVPDEARCVRHAGHPRD